MSSKCFVLNEWIIEDLKGVNGKESQKESFRFLKKLKTKCDRIAVLNDSPWMRKAYNLMKCDDLLRHNLSKYLHLSILQDSKKCILLDRSKIRALPGNLRDLVPPDDLYLFEIYFSSGAEALVTTDLRLLRKVNTIPDLNICVRQRDDFLKEYLKKK